MKINEVQISRPDAVADEDAVTDPLTDLQTAIDPRPAAVIYGAAAGKKRLFQSPLWKSGVWL
jgi:hypothetical protein